MGCLFPKAQSLGAYWANIKNGVDGITEIPETHWAVGDYFDEDPKRPDFTYGKRGGFLDPVDFNPMHYNMPPNTLEATDTAQLFGMLAAEMALDDAGYGATKEFDRQRVSVVLGVTGALELVVPLGARLGHPKWKKALRDAGVDESTTQDVLDRIGESYVPWQENSFPGLLGNVVAGRITKHLNLGGTNCVVDAACASSLSALHLAAMELATGKSDLVVTGGVDTFNDIFMYMCFSKTPALSPTGNAKPFDAAGDGTILGEGLGMVVLKRLEDAERDGDQVYAVLRGIGSSSDGKGDAIYAPSAEGQTRALRRAYDDAQVDPASIELVEAHGTGTAAGDAAEIKALNEVYGKSDAGPWCALGSVKSQIGHTKAAAGAAGIIKAALALHHKTLPPTIKVQEPLPILREDATPFYVNTAKRPWLATPDHPRRAAVSALGFGGSNFHCVLEEASPVKGAPDWEGNIELVAISGATNAALQAQLQQLAAAPDWNAFQHRARAARESFDPRAGARLAFTATAENSAKQIATALDALAKNSAMLRWSLPAGIYYDATPAPGPVALLFPGQGAQYVGMLRDLACQFPEALQALQNAEDVARGSGVPGADRPCNAIFPPPAFNDSARKAQEAHLTQTQVAQPAIGVISLAALEVLRRFGLHADAVAGHSFGELTALHAAGTLTRPDFLMLARLRGTLMAAQAGSGSGMTAVKAGKEAVAAVLDSAKTGVVIANHNAPDQVVISGTLDDLAQVEAVLKEQKLSFTRLPVAAAFHSAAVAQAAAPLLEAMKPVSWSTPHTTVYANTTGAPYPEDPQAAKTLFAQQLANPVAFVDQIQHMYDAGIRTFVEVGPGKRLAGLVKAILPGDDVAMISLDASAGKRHGIEDLGRALAELSALGHALTLTTWNEGIALAPLPVPGAKPKLTYKISGANYVTPRKPKAPAAPRPIAATPPFVATPQQPASPAPRMATAAPQTAHASASMHEGLLLLQQMQERTAALHEQFLQGQKAALETFRQLLGHPVAQTFAAPAAFAPQPAPQAPAAAPAIAPTVAPVATEPRGADTRRIEAVLLSTVADKTGYPVDMLELDMALDADLGIDSIKRVEILSALKDQLPEAPAIGPEELGRLQTLRQVVEHLARGMAQAASPHSVPAADANKIEGVLLATVADKTGYPVDMLELDMALDADLGIDSIKRVEILSALKDQLPEAPAIGPEELGRLQTLRQVVEHLAKGMTPSAPAPAASQAAPSVDASRIEKVLLNTVAEKTGYPVDMLELDMALDADLGIDSIKRVEILSAIKDRMPELPAIGPEDLGRLQTLRQVAAHLASTHAKAQAAPAGTQAFLPVIQTNTSAAGLGDPIHAAQLTLVPFAPAAAPAFTPGAVLLVGGPASLSADLALALQQREILVHCASLTDALTHSTPKADTVILVAPEDPGASFMQDAFQLLKNFGAVRQAAGEGAWITITLQGGSFALEDCGASPMGGGLAGLTKTAALEWTHLHCRALDTTAGAPADQILDTCLATGPVELALTNDGLRQLILLPWQPEGASRLPLDKGDVVIVTGGARGVTAATAIALAEAAQPTLVLLGRSAAPEAEPAWLAALDEEKAIKQALLQQESGLTPKTLQAAYDRAMNNRAALQTLARIEGTGARAVYLQADIRDANAVAQTVATVREHYGPIRGLVHGAGVLADRHIADKTPEQFAFVFGTKIDGIQLLLDATQDDDLRIIALFSSSTGRFGRVGQVDYAAANEILNKIAQRESRRRPQCRVCAFNWGPWAGGMVDASLAEVFRKEGVGLIGLHDGARFLVDTLAQESIPPAELVVMGGPIPGVREPGAEAATVAFSLGLSVAEYPFLRSHVLNNKAVLPVAVMLEWLAQGALHENPGLRFHGLDNLRVLKGVTLTQDETVPLDIKTGKAQRSGDQWLVPVSLEGERFRHAAAVVVLREALPTDAPRIVEQPLKAAAYNNGGLYDSGHLFHGPEFQSLDQVDGAPDILAARVKKAPAPASWIQQPLRNAWIADPLAIDSSFQMMILWSFKEYNTGSLPTQLGAYRQFKSSFPREGVRITAQVLEHDAQRAFAVIEFVDPQSQELVARITGYECTLNASLNEAFRNNTLPAPSPVPQPS
ncbi:MAG: SDR family NAD(P)-dependent oxidoreductase [Candidatus Hydrogenedentes bacterium]|nr:SDR family NAD(P)-dependent oxidoreductase [Candidatus Hydrogenedentota bacterium]